jgi:50S ribosomal subunit-associated GTPase HflX
VGLHALETRLADELAVSFVPIKVQIPYTMTEFVNLFRSRGMVETEDHRPEGTMISGRLPATLLPDFQRFLP